MLTSLWQSFQDGVDFLCHRSKSKLKLVLKKREKQKDITTYINTYARIRYFTVIKYDEGRFCKCAMNEKENDEWFNTPWCEPFQASGHGCAPVWQQCQSPSLLQPKK